MQYTDIQLKQTLAKMLPEKIRVRDNEVLGRHLAWNNTCPTSSVCDTELLHLCWLVEEDVDEDRWSDYLLYLVESSIGYSTTFKLSVRETIAITHSTWQQHVVALAKVKGIEIV